MENSLWMKLPWMNGSKHMMQLLSVGKTPMIYSMSVGMFSMKRANGVSHYIPSTATSAAAQAANAAYRSTSWYSAVGLARLGW